MQIQGRDDMLRQGAMQYVDGNGYLARGATLDFGPASTDPSWYLTGTGDPATNTLLRFSFGKMPSKLVFGSNERILGSWTVRAEAGADQQGRPPTVAQYITRGTFTGGTITSSFFELFGIATYTTAPNGKFMSNAARQEYMDRRRYVRIAGTPGTNAEVSFELSDTPPRPVPTNRNPTQIHEYFPERSLNITATFITTSTSGRTDNVRLIRTDLHR